MNQKQKFICSCNYNEPKSEKHVHCSMTAMLMWGRKFGAREINYLNECESTSVNKLPSNHMRYLGFVLYSWNSHIAEAVLISHMPFSWYLLSLPHTIWRALWLRSIELDRPPFRTYQNHPLISWRMQFDLRHMKYWLFFRSWMLFSLSY